MTSITIKGIDALITKIETVSQLKAVRAALRSAAVYVKGKIAIYPPTTEANTPGGYPKRWYQRGYGQRWALKGGGVGGRKTSEALGRKWTTAQPRSSNGGFTQTVGVNVKYGPFVQGEEQASFHRDRGWKTTDDIMEQEAASVNDMVIKAIELELEK